VLATYELGRRAFNKAVGLLAGIIVASTVCFCAAAHFANPDALLNACSAVTLLVFFAAYRRGDRWWSLATGATTGLGFLAKGPVGLVLPTAVLVGFLLWERQLRRLWDWRMLSGVLTFLAVGVPWYVWVGLETKGQWLREFFCTHNVNRFNSAMENHNGPIYYYVLILAVGFAPWSIFLALTVWNTLAEIRPASTQPFEKRSLLHIFLSFFTFCVPQPAGNANQSAMRFLTVWIGVYFLFFSLAGTKLPNYILPLYPPLAVLMSRLLDRYRTREIRVPAWSVRLSLICLGFIGVGLIGGLMVVGGAVPVDWLRGRYLPGLQSLAIIGLVPLVGAYLGWRYARQDRRSALLRVVAVTAVLLTATVAMWGPLVADSAKAPRALAGLLPADQTSHDVRIATYDYFQPSLVFYCQREVDRFSPDQRAQVQEFLDGPLPSYLILRAQDWDKLRPHAGVRCHTLGSKFDFYDGDEIVVVTNVSEGLAASR
jgi:4-amino-4-deoxy-L-arabinose transferase-like glycosyltransferase